MDNAYSWNIPFYLVINHYVFYKISIVSRFLRVIEITVHTAGKTVTREALSHCAWSDPIWRRLLILLLGNLF